MNQIKKIVHLMALFLIIILTVSLVSAEEQSATPYQLPRLQFNESQEIVTSQNGFGLVKEQGISEIPIGSVIYHSSNGKTRIFDGKGKQLLIIDDYNSTKIKTSQGMVDSTRILNVPNGVLIKSNNNITQVFRNDEPILTVINENGGSGGSVPQPNSWIEDAHASIANLGYFSAEWTVPSSPTTGIGIQDSLFNAIEPRQYGPGGRPSIIQPVLVYTNNWKGYVEYWDSYGNWYDSPKINAIPEGDLIQGSMQWDPSHNYWGIRFWDETSDLIQINFSVQSTEIQSTDLDTYITLEGANIGSNTDLPGTTTFSNIELKDDAGNPISANWNTWVNPNFQEFISGLAVTSSSSSTVTLFTDGYTITPSAEAGGTILPSDIQYVRRGSNSPIFIITANPGYLIDQVFINGVSQGYLPTYTFLDVQSDSTIHATFRSVPITYPIIPSTGTGGSMSPSTVVNVPSGGSQNFTINPNSGYIINSVVVDGMAIVPAPTIYTFTNVTSSHTINATFVALPIASFTATPRTGAAPLSVTFTDTSTGSPTGWAWFFGDENFTAPWTPVNASAGWSARVGHSSVVMPDGSIVLTGGWDGSCKNDVWRSTNNGVTWTRVNASAGWSARAYHSSVALPDGSIVLMGGYDSTGEKNDVWRSANNGATWTRMTANASWSARSDHSSVAMPDGSIVLMGGWYISSGMNDVWRSTDKGATWVRMNASAGWSTRADHSSVAMPDGSIVLTGGADNSGFKNDTWRSTNNGATWTRVNASAGWSARAYHSSVAMPDGSIVLMGGYNTGTTGASKTDSGQSVRDHRRIMATSGDSPAPMAVSDSSGGVGEEKNDVWRSTNNGTTWVRVNPNAGWTPRDSFSSTAMPDGGIVLMGGGDNDVYNNNVWRLIPAGSSARNPVHIYTLPGLYKVSLQVNNAAGYNSTRKTGYVNVTPLNDGIALFRNSTGYWYFDSNLDGVSEKSFRYGNNGDRIIKGDWLGTGKDGIANVSSSTGNWSFDYNLDGIVDKSFLYGNSLDKIVAGDWNGTGRDGIAIFRPSTGYWYFDNNLDGVVDWNFRFGGNPYNDTPVVGDWNSTGRDGIAIFRNETGYWYFDKNLDSVIDYSFRFGGSPNYDQVSVGNWNGTGKDGIAIFRQSTGYWYFDYNLDGGIDNSFRFGSINDRIFTGDWTGSGKDGIALFRPSTGYWYFDNNLDGVVDKSFRYGNSTDQIIAGKWA
jgi:PKD repeat protein